MAKAARNGWRKAARNEKYIYKWQRGARNGHVQGLHCPLVS